MLSPQTLVLESETHYPCMHRIHTSIVGSRKGRTEDSFTVYLVGWDVLPGKETGYVWA